LPTATSGIVADPEMRGGRHPRRELGMDRHDSPGVTDVLAQPFSSFLHRRRCA
jgi:hypothetical protein